MIPIQNCIKLCSSIRIQFVIECCIIKPYQPMLAILQQYDDALSILLLKFQRIGFCKTTFNIKRSTITKPIKHINYRFAILISEWNSIIAYIPILIKILIVIAAIFYTIQCNALR